MGDTVEDFSEEEGEDTDPAILSPNPKGTGTSFALNLTKWSRTYSNDTFAYSYFQKCLDFVWKATNLSSAGFHLPQRLI